MLLQHVKRCGVFKNFCRRMAGSHQKFDVRPETPVSLAYATYDPDGKIDKDSPIFILHGLFGSKQNWNTLAKNLSLNTNRRVITVDLRNHGESPHVRFHGYMDMAADLRALLKELVISNDKASFIGHSMGGRATMTTLLANPEMGRDLVVVDVSPVGSLPHVDGQLEIYAALKALPLDDSLSLSEMRKKCFDELGKNIRNEGLRKFLVSNLIKENEKFRWRVNLDVVASESKNLKEMPLFGKNVFDKPTLFLCGERSDYVPHEHHKGIYQLFPKARIEYFRDTGHLPHAERPDLFLSTVTEFFNKNYSVK